MLWCGWPRVMLQTLILSGNPGFQLHKCHRTLLAWLLQLLAFHHGQIAAASHSPDAALSLSAGSEVDHRAAVHHSQGKLKAAWLR